MRCINLLLLLLLLLTDIIHPRLSAHGFTALAYAVITTTNDFDSTAVRLFIKGHNKVTVT